MPFKNKSLKLAKKIFFLFCLFFVFHQLFPFITVYAKEVGFDYGRGPVEVNLINHPENHKTNDKSEQKNINSTLPDNEELPYYEMWITATAYNSLPNQTDDSPFLAAWGDHVFWGMIASNHFPKNTKIQIPDYFGNKMFSVLDTMNKRYQARIDIWMPNQQDAKNWGAKYIKIKVYK